MTTASIPSHRPLRLGSLDLPSNLQALQRHGIDVSEPQRRIFHALESDWPVDVVAPLSGPCLAQGRLSNDAAQRYFGYLARVWALGPQASIAEIVAELGRCHAGNEGLGAVLFIAVRCQLYSDTVGHEAYRQLMAQPTAQDAGPLTSHAIAAYQDLMGWTQGWLDDLAWHAPPL